MLFSTGNMNVSSIKTLLYVTMVGCLASCGQLRSGCKTGTDVKVLNRSGSKQHVKLSTSENSFIEFEVSATTTEKDTLLCFDKNPKIDGQCVLKITGVNIDSTDYFGYYTNGYPLSSKNEIVINKESFTAKEVH